MRLSNPRVWVACLSAAAVLYFVLGVAGRRPPGEIAAVHAAEPALTGPFSCDDCHGGWFGSMAVACLECHKDIGTQVEDRKGLHGVMGRETAMACALCHSEHHGRDFALVNRQSFAAAGVPEPEKFDHGMIGFAMAGKHMELECAECHKSANVAILAKGEKRYGGLEQDCASCHEDVHEGRYVLACASCHGQESFKSLASEGHEEHLALVGGHGDVECRTCHAERDPRSLEVLGTGPDISPRACADCHDSPHGDDFVVGVARLAAKPPGRSCAVCHEPLHASFQDERLVMTPAQHAASGFLLVEPHQDMACAECHAPWKKDFAARYPGRGMDDCARCHEDPHRGQFEGGPFAADGCLGCHDRLRFEPHTFTVEAHGRAALPLTGRHLEIGCNDCHLDPIPRSPRVFRGTPARCEGCHKDAHEGFFGRLSAQLGESEHGRCAVCHVTSTFSEAEPFDHRRDTGFDVLGAHLQDGCAICHPRGDTPDETGRTFGRVEEHFGKFEGCVTCHADPHKGMFDGFGRPRKVRGNTGCARCHVQTSFRAFPEGFEHALWTGFPLQGAHGKADCSACHAQLRKPDESGRTWGPAKGDKCADCHTDPHSGQFQVRGVTRCEKCHRSAMSFADLTFRHDLDSRFRLGEAHEKVACSACHKTFLDGDRPVVRYRPLGTRCVDCHGEQEEPLRRRKEGKK